MARRYMLPNGESSFDGIHPASVRYCGEVEFGYHNNKNCEGCVNCGKFTHYSIHRRYKFSKNLETNERCDRLWICSNKCFQNVVFRNTFDLVLPWEVSEKVLAFRCK